MYMKARPEHGNFRIDLVVYCKLGALDIEIHGIHPDGESKMQPFVIVIRVILGFVFLGIKYYRT